MAKCELTVSSAGSSPGVTLCPPGLRSREVVKRAPVESPVTITTATALQSPASPSRAPSAKDDRRSAQERLEAAQRAEAVSVAAAQPHRAGADDPLDPALATPLWHFCLKAWPKRITDSGADVNADHRRDMFRAGQHYGIIVHQHRVWLGLGSGGRTQAEGLSVTLTDAQIRAHCEAARIKRDDADDALRGIFNGAVSAMMRVAVEEQPPTPSQEDLLRHCLWSLAVHFGFVKLGRFGGLTG